MKGSDVIESGLIQNEIRTNESGTFYVRSAIIVEYSKPEERDELVVYRCVAENPAGSIEISFKVRMLENQTNQSRTDVMKRIESDKHQVLFVVVIAISTLTSGLILILIVRVVICGNYYHRHRRPRHRTSQTSRNLLQCNCDNFRDCDKKSEFVDVTSATDRWKLISDCRRSNLSLNCVMLGSRCRQTDCYADSEMTSLTLSNTNEKYFKNSSQLEMISLRKSFYLRHGCEVDEKSSPLLGKYTGGRIKSLSDINPDEREINNSVNDDSRFRNTDEKFKPDLLSADDNYLRCRENQFLFHNYKDEKVRKPASAAREDRVPALAAYTTSRESACMATSSRESEYATSRGPATSAEI